MSKYDLVLLLGGTGSRMKNKPEGNKHLVKVNGKSNIKHIKDKIIKYEDNVQPFENKYIVTNSKGVESIMQTFGQGYNYLYQEKPTGIPDAAKLANPKNPFLLHLGDQYYTDNLASFIEGFYDSNDMARMWLKYTDDTNHTVALIDDNHIKRLVEKPNYSKGIKGYVATGMYMIKPELLKYVNDLPRHEKNENNMSDLLNTNLDKIGAKLMKGEWTDINNREFLKMAERYK